ncbi:hypothetical protein ACLKA6_014134 [Drosophila palustris]
MKMIVRKERNEAKPKTKTTQFIDEIRVQFPLFQIKYDLATPKTKLTIDCSYHMTRPTKCDLKYGQNEEKKNKDNVKAAKIPRAATAAAPHAIATSCSSKQQQQQLQHLQHLQH